jgi:hypothetical protein
VESITKLIGHEAAAAVVSAALGEARLSGTGVSGAVAARPLPLASREAAVAERPLAAPAAAVVTPVADPGYAVISVIRAGAVNRTFGQQKTQLHTMWALRGLDPRSHPA